LLEVVDVSREDETDYKSYFNSAHFRFAATKPRNLQRLENKLWLRIYATSEFIRVRFNVPLDTV